MTSAALTIGTDESLAAVMAERRGYLKSRIVLAFVMLAAFGALTGWAFAAAWCAIYVGSQVLESRLFKDRYLGDRTAIGFIVAGPFVFGVMPLSAPFSGGAWAAPCTAIAIAGLLAHTTLSNRRSLRAFRASLIGPTAYSLALPGVLYVLGAPWTLSLAVGVAGLLNIGGAIKMWRVNYASYEREQGALAAKEAIMAVVAHELRTPMSAILAAAGELERNTEPSVRGRARLIGDAGVMMRGLLNDLLDRSKLDAGRLNVEAIEFDLRNLIADEVALWGAEARRKGLRLTVNAARTAPRRVVGDPTRLRQVLNNLFSNALKFTDKGGVHLALNCSTDGGLHRLRFDVRDTGPGLTPDDLERLFTPFDQLKGSIARSHGGTGLGLALSKDLAVLMGGDLTVQSETGQGAEFSLILTLPAGRADPAAHPLRPSVNGRVLIVDDHEINRRAIRLILEGMDLRIAECASAGEALERLAQEPFDAVLMDCYMPGMDGRTATRRLRAAPGPNRHTPVIAVTASDAEEDVRACRAAGMAWHVPKPIHAESLVSVVSEALQSAPLAAEAAA